jgi:sepiapterin reductase
MRAGTVDTAAAAGTRVDLAGTTTMAPATMIVAHLVDTTTVVLLLLVDTTTVVLLLLVDTTTVVLLLLVDTTTVVLLLLVDTTTVVLLLLVDTTTEAPLTPMAMTTPATTCVISKASSPATTNPTNQHPFPENTLDLAIAMARHVAVIGSRHGFGRSLCEAVLDRWRPQSLLATARSVDSIFVSALEGRGQGKTKVLPVAADLAVREDILRCAGELSGWVHDAEAGAADACWDTVLIHNAGVVWPMHIAGEESFDSDYFDMVERALRVNAVSFSVLCNSYVAAHHRRWQRLLHEDSGRPKLPGLIINVSSLAAVKAFPSWGQYCGSKAYREAVLKVLDIEQQSIAPPPVLTLSYAPGPMDTDMQREIREEPGCDLGVRDSMRATQLLNPDTSANVLLDLVSSGCERVRGVGGRVDVFDLAPHLRQSVITREGSRRSPERRA